jgi:hypothetical protein
VTENCTNGVDDDCNGHVDCDDPACGAGFSCVDVPAGWQGPFALLEGGNSVPPTPCAGFGTLKPLLSGGSGAQGAPATCSQCTCKATCQPAALSAYPVGNSGCNGPAVTIPQPLPGACAAISDTAGSFMAEPGTPSCASSLGMSSVPPSTWTKTDAICAPTATGTCGPAAGQCVANPPGQLAGPCILKAGSQGCPASFPTAIQYSPTVVDTRSCTSCGCSAGNVTCAGNTHLYAAAGCSGAITDSVPNDNACHVNPVSALTFQSIQVDMAPNGTCSPSGGAPTGGVMDGPVVTVCCSN